MMRRSIEEARHAAGARRLDLLGGHGQQAAAEYFRRIAGRAERQRDDRAGEGIAQDRPEKAAADERELAEAVIDQEHLDQQRRAAEHEDIGARNAAPAAGWPLTRIQVRPSAKHAADA